jgi:hypothetical protein
MFLNLSWKTRFLKPEADYEEYIWSLADNNDNPPRKYLRSRRSIH